MRGLFLLSSHVFSSQLLMSGSEEPSDRLDVARTDGSLSGANKTKKTWSARRNLRCRPYPDGVSDIEGFSSGHQRMGINTPRDVTDDYTYKQKIKNVLLIVRIY